MARKLLTPPINTRGLFTVFSPFVVQMTTVYRCTAIRTFDVLITQGIDVFEKFYTPLELSEDIYTEDFDMRASIVTLVSSEGEHLYIPNTFIESYPGMNGLDYNRKLFVMDLGLLPSHLSVANMIPDVVEVIAKVVGVSATCEYVEVPYIQSITQAEHVQLESSRLSAIRGVTPMVQRVADLEIINNEQSDLIEQLTQALADAQA